MAEVKEENHVCYKIAVYNASTGKVEFAFMDFVSKIQKVIGASDSKIVIATAIGQPESGKTKVLSRLLQHWAGGNLGLPAERFCGIIGLITTKPRVFKTESVYLVCLDVVWNVEKLAGYKELVETCYRISNLVTFTFCKLNPPLQPENMIKLNTVKPGPWKAIAVLRDMIGWLVWQKYYAKLDEFVLSLDDYTFDVTKVRKAAMTLAGVAQDVPVQLDRDHFLASQEQHEDICCDLIHSVDDDEFRKALPDGSNLIEVFQVNGTDPEKLDTNNDLQLAMVKLQVTASFRELAPKLIDSFVSSGAEKDFSSCIVSIRKFGQTEVALGVESQHELQSLVQQLKQDLIDCCIFFYSLKSMVDKHFQYQACLNLDEFAEFERELNVYLAAVLKDLKQGKSFLDTLCTGVLAKYISTLNARNQDILRTEELLVKSASHDAFEAYATLMDRKLAGKIWSERDIRRFNQGTFIQVRYLFASNNEYFISKLILELMPRIKSYVRSAAKNHAEELAKFRKPILEAFGVCRVEFDSVKTEFGTIAELKRDGQKCLAAALKKLEEVNIKKQLSAAGVSEVHRMLENYCFHLMYTRTCEFPRAAEVLAKKCHITIIPGYNGSLPVKIIAEGLPEPILMDSYFWLENGTFVVMERHLSSRYMDSSLDLISVAYERGFEYDASRECQSEDLLEVTGMLRREQILALYFKGLKKYLLEEYHIIPSKVTVVLSEATYLGEKHRMDAAIRLSGLPSPKFMFHVGTVATGFYRKNPDLKFGEKTLFVVFNEGWARWAKCQLKNIVRVTDFETTSWGQSLDKVAEYVLNQVKEDVNISSVVVIHNFRGVDGSWKNEHQLPDSIVMYHDQCVTGRELLDLEAEGAAFVNTYSHAVYHEATCTEFEVVWDCGGGSDRTSKTLVGKNVMLEHDVLLVDTVTPERYFWVNDDFDMDDFNWRVSIETTPFPLIQFQLNVPRSTTAVTYTLRLRKDGILCEPEFRDNSTGQLVQWEVIGGLRPWSQDDFQVELWKLADIESTSLRLLKAISEGIKAMKLELKEVVEELEKCLEETTSARATVVEQISSKLEKAKKMLNARDETDVVEIEAMIKKIKCCIGIVKSTR